MSETTPLLENSPTVTAYSDGSATEYTPSLASSRAWIPQVRSNRTLVLCFDGTGDQFDQDVSAPSFVCPALFVLALILALVELEHRPVSGYAQER